VPYELQLSPKRYGLGTWVFLIVQKVCNKTTVEESKADLVYHLEAVSRIDY